MIKNRLYGMSVYNLDGLTLQELLCQYYDLISQCVNDVNKYTEMVKNLLNWIKEQGVKDEVLKLMEQWKTDGTLQNIINEEIFNDLNNKIQELELNINTFKTEVNTNFTRLEEDIVNKFDDFQNQYSQKIIKNETDIKEMINTKDTTVFYILNNTTTYGDCILIHADDGSYSMIDTGWDKEYLGFIQQLDKIGLKKLKYLFITHDHSDHIGNAPMFIEKYKPQYLVTKGGIDYDRLPPSEVEWNTKQYHDNMINACNTHGVEIIYAEDKDYLIGKNDVIRAYNSKFYDYSSLNGMSITYVLKSKGTYSMFCGDSTANSENNIINTVPKCEFMKLSHHGGEGGNQYKYIEKVKPKYGFVNRFFTANSGYELRMAQNAVKVVGVGGKIYSNDNNLFGAFKIGTGYIEPCCNSYSIPLEFIDMGNGKYKMTNESGYLASSGVYKVRNLLYIVKDNGTLADNTDGWITYGGYQYIANTDNTLKTNEWVEVEGKYYWVNDKGQWNYWNNIISYKNNVYIIDSKGVMCTNQKIGYEGHYYYLQSSGNALCNSWFETSEGWVYADSQCHLVNGRYFINGLWYNFNDYICANPNNGEPPDYIVTP